MRIIIPYTTLTDKHGRVVMVPCKGDSGVSYCTRAYTGQWICHVLQGTRNTRPCRTGHPVHHYGSFILFQTNVLCTCLVGHPV